MIAVVGTLPGDGPLAGGARKRPVCERPACQSKREGPVIGGFLRCACLGSPDVRGVTLLEMNGTNHDLSSVRPATLALANLRDELLERIDLFWWSLPIDVPDAAALRDYTIGTFAAAQGNLEQAAVAGSLFSKMWTAQATEMSSSFRDTGELYGAETRRPRMYERGIELRSHRVAFFVSLGAALDALAAGAIGVLGIPLPVIRADLGTIVDRTWGEPTALRRAREAIDVPDLREMQASTLASLRETLAAAGPTGWLWWMLDERNTLVHREHRLDITNVNRRGRTLIVENLLPRQPEMSNVEALATSKAGLAELFLSEHAVTTMTGLRDSTATVLRVGASALSHAWRLRSETRPNILWREQWRIPRPGPAFDGYDPGSSPVDPTKTELHMGPEQIKRLKEAGLIDPPGRS